MQTLDALFNSRKSCRGVSLIIAVFSLMLLGVLGLVMAMMISGDFEMNSRNLESEQAFHLADAGIQEAVSRLQGNSTFFDTDAKRLNRRLGSGEYNVSRSTNGTQVTLVSSGYIPAQTNYRAMRQVEAVFIPVGDLNAIAGGLLFDWHNTTSIAINGDVSSQNFEGNDLDSTVNEAEDLNVPGSGARIQSADPIPDIDMNFYLANAQTVYNGNQTFSGNYNNEGIVFVEGNVTIDLSAQKGNFQKTSIIARGNITVTGSKNLAMTAHVNNPQQRTYPNLATENGNILISCVSCGTHDFDGLIFSENGVADINLINGVAVMAKTVRLRGPVILNCAGIKKDKYVDLNNGFNLTGGSTVFQWKER